MNTDQYCDSQTETISNSPRETVETVGWTVRQTNSAFQQKHPCPDVQGHIHIFAGLPAMFCVCHGPLRGHEKGTGPLSQHQVLAWGLLKAQTHMTTSSCSWPKHQPWHSWTDCIWIFIICCEVINACYNACKLRYKSVNMHIVLGRCPFPASFSAMFKHEWIIYNSIFIETFSEITGFCPNW